MANELKLIAINLKHLYQRRVCWIIYIFFLLVAIFPASTILTNNNKGSFDVSNQIILIIFFSIMMNMFWGMIVGDIIRTVALSPLAICLPGYKKIPIKIIKLTAIIINIIYAGTIAYLDRFSGGILFIFTIGLLTFSGFASIAIKTKNPGAMFGFFGFLGAVNLLGMINVTR